MSGYVPCACRDCMEIAMSTELVLCDECAKVGNRVCENCTDDPPLCDGCKDAGCEVCPLELEGRPTRECGCSTHECQVEPELEEEEEEEGESSGPTAEDWITYDHRRFVENGTGKIVLELREGWDMWTHLQAEMDRRGFYPNVWFVSDHGNEHLLTPV